MSDEDKRPMLTRESTWEQVLEALEFEEKTSNKYGYGKIINYLREISGFPRGFRNVGDLLDDEDTARKKLQKIPYIKNGIDNFFSLLAETGLQKEDKPALTRESTWEEVANVLSRKSLSNPRYGKIANTLLNNNGFPRGFSTVGDLLDNEQEAKAAFRREPNVGHALTNIFYSFLEETGLQRGEERKKEIPILTRESTWEQVVEALKFEREASGNHHYRKIANTLLNNNGFPRGFSTVGDLLDNEQEAKAAFRREPNVGHVSAELFYSFLKENVLRSRGAAI